MALQRNPQIDIMRALGLVLIFLSHSNPSADVVLQLRCFDVPMMIFISGLTFSQKVDFKYWTYVKKRTTRLIFPVWCFLFPYLSVLALAQNMGFIPEYLTWKMSIESFFLCDGIGYVWIFRVFLLIMLLTPILAKLEAQGKFISSLYVLISLGIVEALVYMLSSFSLNGILCFIVKDILVYAIGYSILFVIGMNLRHAKQKNVIFWGTYVLVIFAFVSLIYCINHGLPIRITPDYKYPPRTYFLVYGMFVSTVIWLSRKYWGEWLDSKFILFLGQNTIWIYLWHIPVVLLCTRIDVWLVRFLVLLILPLAIYSIQYKVVTSLNISPKLKQILIG